MFFDPMLSRKTFATYSLKLTFVLDVWFGCDCVCSNIEHLLNNDEIKEHCDSTEEREGRTRKQILKALFQSGGQMR